MASYDDIDLDDTQPLEHDSKPLDDLLEPGSTLMVGTMSGADHSWEFRPLTVARVQSGGIDILLDTREEWVTRFETGDLVHIVLSDTRKNDWSHLVGSGTISKDEALIDELWSPFAAAYFDEGRETPGIAVFRLSVARGRYWSTPSGRVGALISMVSAALGRDGGGEHGDVKV
jgi:general stress protein 26